MGSVKAAILLTLGPVSTYSAFSYSGPRPLRWISKQQYIEAVIQLQEESLGTTITLKKGACPSAVCFIKKPPAEAKKFLQIYGYTYMEKYKERYDHPVPTSIKRSVWDKLVQLGYFPESGNLP